MYYLFNEKILIEFGIYLNVEVKDEVVEFIVLIVCFFGIKSRMRILL